MLCRIRQLRNRCWAADVRRCAGVNMRWGCDRRGVVHRGARATRAEPVTVLRTIMFSTRIVDRSPDPQSRMLQIAVRTSGDTRCSGWLTSPPSCFATG